MDVRSACLGITAVIPAVVVPAVAAAAPFRFDRAQYQPEGLDSVSAVSGASIIRNFPQEPSTYHCPTSRVWIGALDADRTKSAYWLMLSSGATTRHRPPAG